MSFTLNALLAVIPLASLRRDNSRVDESGRQGLLKLIEWLGQNIVRMAGT